MSDRMSVTPSRLLLVLVLFGPLLATNPFMIRKENALFVHSILTPHYHRAREKETQGGSNFTVDFQGVAKRDATAYTYTYSDPEIARSGFLP